MMNIAAKYRFAISGNFHGGAEVVNYPWDTWVRLHPDDAWMFAVSRAYADTAHKYAPAAYLRDLNDGITNGYDWYRITGGRQDYFTYFHRGREITFEISNVKLLNPANLPAHWEYNYRSLLHYLQNALYGIKGVVTNTAGQPLKAKIFIQNHDVDNADILTDSSTGVFTRMIAPGTYTVVVSADSHITQTFTNIVVVNRQATTLNVTLQPVNQPTGITWQSGLNIRDNGNENGILTFGLAAAATNGIDPALGEITLPPTPPSGVFDLRFELPVTPAEYSAKDYRKDTATVASWLLKFQPGPGGYPFTFTWNQSALPVGSFTLKDAITGTLISVDMKAQNSYTLSNTGITSLIIQYTKSACSNVNLASGWNLVSVPLVAANMGTTTIFPQANSAAYAFNNGYVTATTLTNGAGYWVRYPQSAVSSVCGSAVSVSTIPVVSGWNLIGPYHANATVSGISSTPAGIINSVFYGFNNGYTQAATLETGKGYWVRVTQSGVLNLPATAAKASDAEVFNFPENYTRLIVRDASGQQQTVYMAPAGEMVALKELPPVPPAEILDVRFANNANVASSATQLLISGAQYPVTLQVIGSGLTISDIITDGKLVQKNIGSGETFTLQNSSIQALMINRFDKPAVFSLEQNYPNPFNPSTVITYSLATSAQVTLEVFDVLGNKVATLVNEVQKPGSHGAAFSSETKNNLASGLYLYRLRAGNNVAIKKMLLLK